MAGKRREQRAIPRLCIIGQIFWMPLYPQRPPRVTWLRLNSLYDTILCRRCHNDARCQYVHGLMMERIDTDLLTSDGTRQSCVRRDHDRVRARGARRIAIVRERARMLTR